MLKKILSALLASLMLVSFAACGADEGTTGDDTNAGESTATNYTGTLEELVDAIYKVHPLEAKMGPATQIDLANTDNLAYYLGLKDATGVKEAVFSEPMMSSIAYSLCLVRTEEGADIEAIKKNILDGVDQMKWFCVEADQVLVTNYGDVILLLMVSSQLGETLAQDLCNAFATSVGGEVTNTLTK